MGKTSIQWTEHSINPIRARVGGRVGHHCVKVSPGCTHCYASRMQSRFGLPPFEANKRRDVEVFLDDGKLEEVLRRRKPTTYFWCDMSDLFGEWVETAWIDRCVKTMIEAPEHTHQILTKRSRRMLEYFSDSRFRGPTSRTSLRHVWLGVSVESPDRYDRIHHLRDTPAAVRFLSVEPMLSACPNLPLDGIHLVIFGGESGPGARPCHIDWIRDGLRQCREAGVAAFVKQLGSRPVLSEAVLADWASHVRFTGDGVGTHRGRVLLRDPKGGEPDEWPSDLRVRELPR